MSQTCDSVTATVATFTITHLDGKSATTVKLATAAGYIDPAGITTIGTVTTVPTLLEITPGVGSSAGGVISVSGGGFGKNSTVKLFAGAVDICSKVEITKFGHFFCTTNAVVIPDAAVMKI